MEKELLKEALGKNRSAISTTGDGLESSLAQRYFYSTGLPHFELGKTCYRYCPELKAENDRIGDLMISLTHAHKTWALACFCAS